MLTFPGSACPGLFVPCFLPVIRIRIVLMAKAVLGIDLGGTKIAAGLVSREGEISQVKTIETKAQEGKEAVIARLVDLIKDYRSDFSAVGLGAPGPIDRECTMLLTPPNLTGWLNVPLPKIIHEKTGLKTVFDKDANCALIGEHWIGEAKKYQNAVFLTLGTGIGGAIMKDGKILPAPEKLADEVGHMIVYPASKLTDQAGHLGCAESLIGGWAIEHRTGKNLKYWMNTDHDQDAVKIVDQWYRDLLSFIAKLKTTYQPEVIILAGGVTESVELKRLEKSPVKLVLSDLKYPVILGAAKKVFNQLTA